MVKVTLWLILIKNNTSIAEIVLPKDYTLLG